MEENMEVYHVDIRRLIDERADQHKDNLSRADETRTKPFVSLDKYYPKNQSFSWKLCFRRYIGLFILELKEQVYHISRLF